MIRTIVLALATVAAFAAHAETPKDMIAGYTQEAVRSQPGFAASAERGRMFFVRKWSVTDKMPNCVACHTERPGGEGSHVITGKPIKPLAPAANPERFSSAAKAEKWFRRNCTEVVGRECSAAEKADFVQFLTTAGGA
jgi:mono/diheme cytochrome c family protein